MKNPFIIAGEIPQEYFCDRQEESKLLIRKLTSGENVCLFAPRRIGKSKLIHYCYSQNPLQSDYYCFYIDIYHTSTLREFVYSFGQQVFSTLKGKSDTMLTKFVQTLKSINAQFSYDAQTNMPAFNLSLGDFQRPDYTLEEIFYALEQADKPCVVCFDEFQQIAYYTEKNIEALLRGHIQNLKNTHFIFSGSSRHLLQEMFHSQARPFYNSVSTMKLLPIPLEKYYEFANYWFSKTNKNIPFSIVEHIYMTMERNTFYLQKTMHELFEETSKGETCTLEQVNQIINKIIDENRDIYKHLLSMIPIRQKELLFAIAKDGKAEKIMSSSFIHRHKLISSSAVQTAMKKLLALDIITEQDNVFSISDVLFALYLKEL